MIGSWFSKLGKSVSGVCERGVEMVKGLTVNTKNLKKGKKRLQIFWSSRFLFFCFWLLIDVLYAPHLQTMAKVITSMLKFPPDQAQKVLDKEDSKTIVSICLPAKDTLIILFADLSPIVFTFFSLCSLGYDERLDFGNFGWKSAAAKLLLLKGMTAMDLIKPFSLHFVILCVYMYVCVCEHTLGHKSVVCAL